MDAVELPLPADVAVPKLLTGCSGEAEPSGSVGVDGSVFGAGKVSGWGTYRRDIKRLPPGCSSDFRSKKVDVDHCMHEDMLPSFICKENGDTHHLREADKPMFFTANNERLNRKSLKKLGTLPCSKRPRTDQPDNSMRIDETDNLKRGIRQIKYETIQFPCPEKSQMVKKKRCQDGKRTDKKNNRASMRTKYDSFVSKAGFTFSDSASGGNNILGICGLKSDLRGVAKNVDDLSLRELLDGSYKYANICPDKGKKAPNVNEHILVTIRKAFSALPPPGVVDRNGKNKAPLCLPRSHSYSASTSDSDDKDKCIDDPVPLGKVQDPCQANFVDSILYQPNVIMEKLALPSVNDLDAMLNLSISSPPLQSTMNVKPLSNAGLPPFSWSFSHSGLSRPSVDCGKLASTRNTCHGRWVRIGSNSTSVVDDHSCSSELEVKAFVHSEASINQQKIDDLLQDVKSLSAPVQPSLDGVLNNLQAIRGLSAVNIPDGTTSVKSPGAFGSSSSKKLNLVEDMDSLNNHLTYVSKNCDFLENSEYEIGLRPSENESSMVDLLNCNLRVKGSEMIQKELRTGSTHGLSDSGYCYPCKSAAGGCDQHSWHLSAPEISSPGHSPRAVTAAEILCEITSCSRSTRAQSNASGRTKWPKAPSQKTMKARKSTSSTEKMEMLNLAANHYDSFKSIASVKHRSMSEKKNDFTHMKSAGREPIRWPVPIEDPVRNASLMPSPMRLEKDSYGQLNLRKGTTKAPSLGFGGTYIKDWSRGRSKRM